MTQIDNKSQKRRKAKASSQAVLPLGPDRNLSKLPRSKAIFQLKSEMNRLQQRDREWKMMFNMLSHDLKEPLVTLEGFSKLLSEPDLTEADRKRYLEIVGESVNSLHLLVGSLQSISKLSQEPNEFAEFSIHEIFNSVTTSLSEQIKKTGGKVILPEKDIKIKGDPVRLYQIFLNLIANSLKYHRKSVAPKIVISYRKDKEFHRISIKDNGKGMSAQDLRKIFLPFTRLNDVSTDGLGYGLTIVKRIAESFGGKVSVRSQSNVGTTFTVCLPRQRGLK
jgi:signal transduction histidine kinase